MTRCLLLILFSICVACAHAKGRYKKCTVYTSKPGGNSDSFVSKVQHFNGYGKITEEHYYVQDTAKASQANYTIFYTYTRDTLLSLKKTICFGGNKDCFDDTTVNYYSYDKNNKVSSIISASYGRGGSGCFIGALGTRWYDSTKTEYHYDEKGSLKRVATADLAENMPTGFTMGHSPNFKSYTYDDKNRISSIRHLYVRTLTYLGAEIITEHSFPDTVELAKEVFNYHDKAYTVDLVGTDYDRSVHDISYFFYDQFNNVIQEYIHDRYLGGWHDDPVERFYSYHPDKRLIKEILYNHTGQIERVDNYIYQ